MTVVPHPGLPAGFGPEVGVSIVVDLGGEAQQAAVRVGRHLAGGGGQTVLLVRTLQHEHGPVFHVGGLFHHLRVQHQVRSRWRVSGKQNAKKSPDGEKTANSSVKNSILLSEQETPAEWRPPPLGQLRWSPWWRQWDRDISVPEQRTPLIATASALTSPGQYHVSCGGKEQV